MSESFSTTSTTPDTLRAQLQQTIDGKTKPPGSLGRLEELALQIALWQNTDRPEICRPTMLVFAGDHGASVHGISPYPREVTAQMVLNFVRGGAAINVFARQNRLGLLVVDAGVDADFPAELRLPLAEAGAYRPERDGTRIIDAKVRRGTRDYLNGDALTEAELTRCFEYGETLIEQLHSHGCNTIGLGEMGIGNTSAASLLQSVLTGRALGDCVGRGTGHDDAGLNRKHELLEEALAAYRERVPEPPANPAGQSRRTLRAFGGLELAMMSGALLAAARRRMLVLVDGYITSAAALAATGIADDVRQACVFAHISGERGHQAMLKYLDVQPILNLGLRLGEGTGAALAFPVVQAAVNFLNEMASFDEAGVSDRQPT